MSRLQLLILWILALVAGIAFFNSRDVADSIASQTDLNVGDALVPNSLLNSLDGLKISADGKTTTLVKKEQRWTVAEEDNFPADINKVSRLIENLSQSKIAQGVPASAEYLDRFDLDPAAEGDKKPESITLVKEGAEDLKIFLGKAPESTGGGRGASAGRFVRLAKDDSGVYVTQQSFSALAADPADWIVKTLALVEEGAIKVEVSAPDDDNFKPWTVSRKSTLDNLVLENLGENEETKVSETAGLKTVFSTTSFNELLTAEEVKERAAEDGKREVRVTDSSGSVLLFKITPEKVVAPEAPPADEAKPLEPSNYIVSFEVVNGPVRPEAPAEGASIKDKADFDARLANMGDIALSVENNKKTYGGRHFLINKASLGTLIKNRTDLVEIKKTEKPETVVTTPPVAVPTAPGVPPPGIARPKEPIRAESVTPPVSVPTQTPPRPKGPKKPNFTEPPLPGSKPSETNSPEAPKEE